MLDLPLTAADTALPIRLDLRCTRCGRSERHEVPFAAIHPDHDECQRAGWDGIVLGRVIVCSSCGAEDAYEISTIDKTVLMLRALADHEAHRSGAAGGPVHFAELNLRDGSTVQRPSKAIRHLRAIAEAHPERGEPWRRLGNLCQRFGQQEEAVEAWLHAASDPEEMEACMSLAQHHDDEGDLQQAFDFAGKTIARLSGLGEGASPGSLRHAAARVALGIVRDALPHLAQPLALFAMWTGGTRGDTAICHASSVDLRVVRRWDRLVDFLAADSLAGARLTTELPEERWTQLAALLESNAPIDNGRPPRRPALAPAKAKAKVGRNEPCPCGSGRKYKRCCGA